MTHDVLLIDAVRTPFGRHRGGLSRIRTDDLAALPIAELVSRHPALDPAAIDDVYLGNTNGAGKENRNVARMAALLAGLPVTVPGVTVNRLCASGGEAIVQAGRAVALGDASLVVAGGVEGMSRAPYVLPKAEEPLQRGDWLVLHTDGVTEARGKGGEQFGEQRLADLLTRAAAAGHPPPETARRLTQAVLAHVGETLDDDATVLLASWNPYAFADYDHDHVG